MTRSNFSFPTMTTTSQKLFRLVSWITVEPVELFYCLMVTTSNIVRDNLFIEKVCRLDFNYSTEVCYNYTQYGNVDDDVEQNVQDRVTELELWDGIIVSIPAAFFCLFVGNWSDYHGRKPLLIIPFLGNIFCFLAYILNYYFFYELNTDYLLLSSIYGITGAYQCLNMGLYGYVADVTDLKDRTMRLSVLNGVYSLAYVLGTKLGSVLYSEIGNYYIIFGLSIVFAILGILYTIFFVRESIKKTKEEKESHTFFDFDNVKRSFETAFKARPHNGRLHVILLIINFAVFMFCLNTSHYDYLLTSLKYDWTITEYSNYLTIQRICRLLGLFLLLPLLSRILKVHLHESDSECSIENAENLSPKIVGNLHSEYRKSCNF